MKNICVNFETWTIADGSYSPMKKGDIEVFAIGISYQKLRLSIRKKKQLTQKKNSLYLFSGEVIYCTYLDDPVIVIDTGEFKFFISDYHMPDYKCGDFIEGEGILSIDSYEWMHIWHEEGAPHIYYDFEIDKIVGSELPEEQDIDEDSDVIIMSIHKPNDNELVELESVQSDDFAVNYLEIKMIKEAEPFKILTIEE